MTTPTPESQQAALKPCPFCGSQEIRDGSAVIRCAICGGCAPSTRWNARAALDQQELRITGWIYEDTLPEKYPYDAMYEHSQVIDGVRMFPVFAPRTPAPVDHAALSPEAQNWLDEARFFLARLPVLMPESTAEGIRTTHDLLNRAAELILTALRAHPAGGVSEDVVERFIDAMYTAAGGHRNFDIRRETLRPLVSAAIRAAGIGAGVVEPIPMYLRCDACSMPHIDEGEWATRPHKTHQCQHCGNEWRPANVPTVGVFPLAAAPSHDKGQ